MLPNELRTASFATVISYVSRHWNLLALPQVVCMIGATSIGKKSSTQKFRRQPEEEYGGTADASLQSRALLSQ